MKKYFFASFLLILTSIISFGQNGSNTIYLGIVSPVTFVEPQYEYFVGNLDKEKWNMGYSFAYSSFAADSSSKFEFGAILAFNYSKFRSIDIQIDSITQFDYYGISHLDGDYTIKDLKITGEAFSGDLFIVEMQPTMKYYPISNRDFYVLGGINFSYLNRNVKDKIHYFVDEMTSYIQSDLNVGLSLGAGYNYKMFTLSPNYKFIFTNGMHHYGSLMLGFNF